MNTTYTIPVLLALAALFLILWFLKAKTCNKLLSENLELRKLNDKLSNSKEFKRLKSNDISDNSKSSSSKQTTENSKNTENSSEKSKKNGSKSQKSEESPVVAELKNKIRELKSDNDKLKEKNFNLSKDNTALRSDVRTNASSSEQEKREILSLRESKDAMTVELNEAKAKIADLEKLVADTKPEQQNQIVIPAPAPIVQNSEVIEQLERENASLSAALKDVRGELAGFKRDFKTQLDAAKNEIADSNRALRKELNTAKRQMAQSKKRADNNHQIYLIARAQMLLAEKRLIKLDPSYKPMMNLPAGNDAIEESIKKFVSFDARESRASIDVLHKDKAIDELNEKVRSLENENASLKSGKSTTDDAIHLDDSLSHFVNQLSTPNDMISLEDPSISGIQTSSFASIDLSGLDEDWESI